MWGQKVLGASAHSISSPRPTPMRKKCPGTNEGNLDCQNVLPRTTLSRQAKIMREEGVTSPKAIPLRIAKEIPSPMG